jgi:hypothetical protein
LRCEEVSQRPGQVKKGTESGIDRERGRLEKIGRQ